MNKAGNDQYSTESLVFIVEEQWRSAAFKLCHGNSNICYLLLLFSAICLPFLFSIYFQKSFDADVNSEEISTLVSSQLSSIMNVT